MNITAAGGKRLSLACLLQTQLPPTPLQASVWPQIAASPKCVLMGKEMPGAGAPCASFSPSPSQAALTRLWGCSPELRVPTQSEEQQLLGSMRSMIPQTRGESPLQEQISAPALLWLLPCCVPPPFIPCVWQRWLLWWLPSQQRSAGRDLLLKIAPYHYLHLIEGVLNAASTTHKPNGK